MKTLFTKTMSNNKYGEHTKAINRGLKNLEEKDVINSRQDFRNYAHDQYRKMGLTEKQTQAHMKNKDAGHIVSVDHGGKDTASNFFWEDRHDNRAHGAATVKKAELKRGGRL